MKQLLIFAGLMVIVFSPEIFRFIGHSIVKRWLKSAKSIQDDPPDNDMRLEIMVRNKFTHNWIVASAGMVLARPGEYDLWMPK